MSRKGYRQFPRKLRKRRKQGGAYIDPNTPKTRTPKPES